jgi:GNAT superfamily N-acetyltransferase
VHVRAADPEDADAVARVHVRSWQVGYRGLLPADYLENLEAADRAAHYRFGDRRPDAPETVVAIEHGICGFATIAPAPDDDVSGCGQLCALYVDPPWWGQGVGRLLIAAARDALAQRGFAIAVLWVLAGNDRAQRFYRADGWAPDGAARRDDVWGVTVDEVRYRRPLP